MALAAPKPADMFADAQTPGEVTTRFEAYKSALADCQETSRRKFSGGETAFVRQEGIVKRERGAAGKYDDLLGELSTLNKGAATNDQLAAVVQALEANKGLLDDVLNKDWTNTNPLSTGLVPYDLMPALMMLLPRNFTLRNSIGRISGQGTAKEYRRITGLSNTGVGGVANLNTFFNSTTASASFSGLALNRPPKISYAADRHVVGYVEQGISDEVSMQGQFAAQGYTDLRGLSHTAVTWAHMLGEERNMLYGRGSGTGYTGSIPVSTIAIASASAGTLSGAVYVGVTNLSGYGEGGISAVASASVGASSLLNLTITAGGQGAVNFNVYAGSASNALKLVGNTNGGLTYAITALGTGAAPPATDGTADINAFDGLLAVQTDPTQTGYFKRLGTTLSTSIPGQEFQAAFLALYNSVQADPDEVLLTAAIRQELGQIIKSVGNPNGYRVQIMPGPDGSQIGTVVTAIQNESTGTMVDLTVMPYMPAGCSIIRSRSLPIPDSGVSETVQVANVVDLMLLEWPQIQMSYDLSSYQYGTMLHYAPGWSGAIVGIQ